METTMSTAKRGIDAKRTKDCKFTIIPLRTIDTPAWRELPVKSQALYAWIRLEWKGSKNNNNGKIALSCRQAAQKMGVSLNTAASAFRELQAKGFIFVTKSSWLGVEGKAKLQLYEVTELPLPGSRGGRHLYASWSHGKDYPVISPVKSKPRRKT